jgi:hypothetical protein
VLNAGTQERYRGNLEQYTAINPYTIDNIRGALLTAVPFFDDVCGQKNIDNAEYLLP